MAEKSAPPQFSDQRRFWLADLAATAKFYCEKLGFTKHWFWDDPFASRETPSCEMGFETKNR
jgi:hypothetical protein